MQYDIQVDIPKLPALAKGWDQQAADTGQISSQAGRLTYRDEPGIFADFVRPYNAVTMRVSQLCAQGNTQMQNIADAIMASYNNYVRTEAQNTQQIQGL